MTIIDDDIRYILICLVLGLFLSLFVMKYSDTPAQYGTVVYAEGASVGTVIAA